MYWQSEKLIRRLDIGAGNGLKSLYFAKMLTDMDIKVVIDSIEPNRQLVAELKKNHEQEGNQYLGRVWETTFAVAAIQKFYDIMFSIHSMYHFPRSDDGMILGLESIPGLMKSNSLFVVVSEYDRRDTFQKLKQKFYPRLGIKTEPVS